MPSEIFSSLELHDCTVLKFVTNNRSMLTLVYSTAIVTLVDGDKAEDICKKFDGKELLGTEVAVDIYPNENLLCVAHLPFNLEDSEFQDLVSEFGVLERCFLMRSETGNELL